MLGLELGRRAGGDAPGRGSAQLGQRSEDAPRSSSSPSPVAEETASTPTPAVPEPLAPLGQRLLDLVLGQQVALGEQDQLGQPSRPAP